jgi:uncharacterized protein (DUF433 family)
MHDEQGRSPTGYTGCVSNRISVDPAICSGKPCIAGTRIMVKNILGLFAGGYAMDRVLATYPEISREDVIAALEFAGELADTVGAVTRVRAAPDSRELPTIPCREPVVMSPILGLCSPAQT